MYYSIFYLLKRTKCNSRYVHFNNSNIRKYSIAVPKMRQTLCRLQTKNCARDEGLMANQHAAGSDLQLLSKSPTGRLCSPFLYPCWS